MQSYAHHPRIKGLPRFSPILRISSQKWTTIQKRYAEAKPHEKIYEDIDISLQAVRDHLDYDVEAVISDSSENQARVHKFVKTDCPRTCR